MMKEIANHPIGIASALLIVGCTCVGGVVGFGWGLIMSAVIVVAPSVFKWLSENIDGY